ncbi:hypothetical protein H4S14_000949 [Agrobacterium vitis]|nr:hypothetical protein [Agrobacterium vitis]MBE1437218.1 hypothetical protein [Agrobacterium vitis]
MACLRLIVSLEWLAWLNLGLSLEFVRDKWNPVLLMRQTKTKK